MTVETTAPEHLLLFRGTNWDKDLSPEQIQEVMEQWYGWLDQLNQAGKVKGAQPLANRGKVVSWSKEEKVVDGPFAESKEAIGGYFLLTVDFDEAVEIAKKCPALKYGVTVEVRPIVPQCASMDRVDEILARTATI